MVPDTIFPPDDSYRPSVDAHDLFSLLFATPRCAIVLQPAVIAGSPVDLPTDRKPSRSHMSLHAYQRVNRSCEHNKNCNGHCTVVKPP
jgi:hypothetical protein